MTNIINDKKTTIDVIIPLFKPNNSIKILIHCLLLQTLKINKIIIINSGASIKINNFLNELQNQNSNVILKKVSKLNPGEARNVGINISNANYIVFFDVNTFLELDWIKNNLNILIAESKKIMYAKRITLANSFIKNINKWSTYGNTSYTALTGTIIEREYLIKNNLFFKNARAGEDIDWIQRAKNLNTNNNLYTTDIYYNGIFDNIFKSFYKWFMYAFAYANIEEDLTHQKKLFFFFLIYLISFSYLLINTNLMLFLIFIIINVTLYFGYFSIIRPLKKNVNYSMLFPYNWLLIGLHRFILDLAKSPGLIYGQIKIFLSKIKL